MVLGLEIAVFAYFVHGLMQIDLGKYLILSGMRAKKPLFLVLGPIRIFEIICFTDNIFVDNM
jgi:hypothetical protein